MTDKDKLKAPLEEFGVGFDDDGEIVTCVLGMDKVFGYSSFFTNFVFNEEGKFLHMGAWE